MKPTLYLAIHEGRHGVSTALFTNPPTDQEIIDELDWDKDSADEYVNWDAVEAIQNTGEPEKETY